MWNHVEKRGVIKEALIARYVLSRYCIQEILFAQIREIRGKSDYKTIYTYQLSLENIVWTIIYNWRTNLLCQKSPKCTYITAHLVPESWLLRILCLQIYILLKQFYWCIQPLCYKLQFNWINYHGPRGLSSAWTLPSSCSPLGLPWRATCGLKCFSFFFPWRATCLDLFTACYWWS
jgi:hypothetical protein